MNATKYVLDWFKRGDEDLNVAEILVRENGMLNPVCFHSQQAAEAANFPRMLKKIDHNEWKNFFINEAKKLKVEFEIIASCQKTKINKNRFYAPGS